MLTWHNSHKIQDRVNSLWKDTKMREIQWKQEILFDWYKQPTLGMAKSAAEMEAGLPNGKYWIT